MVKHLLFLVLAGLLLNNSGALAGETLINSELNEIESKSTESKEKPIKIDFSKSPSVPLESKRTREASLITPEPKTALEFNNRAVELGSKGFFPEAIANHRKACEMEPKNIEFRTNLSSACLQHGMLLLKEKKKKQAKLWLQEALKVDSKNKPARDNLEKLASEK